ncbi:MAG: RsmB/NOP family class I SAM-dependent RNA methyltransferase [Acetobacteraceae bacterium]
MTPAARLDAAIALVSVILQQPRAPADAIANAFFRARRYVGAADRRAISEQVWQVLRARRRLGWWLGDDAAVARLLICAALLLSGASIASLQQAFSGARFAPRPLDTAELAALRPLEGKRLEHPDMPEAVRLEVPDCLLEPLSRRFGLRLEAELGALARTAPLDLRVNLLKATREEARAALAAEGIGAAPTPLSPWGLRLEGRTPILGCKAFRSGLVEIQDEASQIAAMMVGAAPGERVLDLCAGSGGKTLALAMNMENRGRIVAADVSEARLGHAVRRLRRAGVHNAERRLLLLPGDKWAKRNAGKFDRVLVDAPCSGTGTWRRHPDARWKIGPAELADIPARQAAILDLAADLVRKQGRLVYATCSVLLEENEAQVSDFLARHAGFAPCAAPSLSLGGGGPGWADGRAGDLGLLLTPARHGTDGFFISVLERHG